MTRSVLSLASAALLGTLVSPAFAQGTAEQREACAPDAVRLCPDTIPDVGRTTVCMRRHEAELSPHCRMVFNGATGGRHAAARRRIARAAPDADDVPGEKRYLYLSPEDGRPRAAPAPEADDAPAVARGPGEDVDPDAADVGAARAAIGRLCRHDVLDPGTCAVTRNALDLAD